MLQFTVNDKRCTRCGLCVRDCVTAIIGQKGEAVPRIDPDQEALCMQCQHCLAICPTAAISILGKKPEKSLPLSPDRLPRLEQMSLLMRGRRSIRQYQDRNVAPALLRRLLATVAHAPTGVNRRELTFSVIDDKAVMRRFRKKVMAALTAADKAGRIPENSAYLRKIVPLYVEQKRDILFRGAPHALVVSAPPDAPCATEDVTLALAYFELLAQSTGLGTVWWGMLKMVLETLPELKPLLDLPAGHMYYTMLFGVPAVHFPRTVQRDDAAIVRKVAV